MNITLYPAFSKKRNSTLRPSEGGFTVSCVLKAPTTQHRPTFELQRNDIPVGSDHVDYIVWSERYYFVSDIRYITNSIIEIDCVLDCLATYKPDILSSTQLIERSSHLYNTDIPDNLNCPTLEIVKSTASLALPGLQFSLMDGTYILTVGGHASANAGVWGNGGATTYALTESQMTQFINAFYDNDFLEQLAMEFLNPMSAIISCRYIPISYAGIQGSEQEIYCGSYGTGVTGKYITYRMKYGEAFLDLTTFFANQITKMGDMFKSPNYLWNEPYTTAVMYLPFVGSVKFPIDLAYKSDTTLSLMAVLDVFTGDIVYSLNREHKEMYTGQEVIATYSGSCSSDCPVSGAVTNAKGQLLSMLQFIGMAAGNLITMSAMPASAPYAMGNFVGNTLSRAANSAVGSLEISTQTNGSISSSVTQFISTAIKVTTITKVPSFSAIGNANDLYGRPLNEVMNLSTFSGYVKCNGAVLNIEADYEARKELEYFLDTGFYIE